MGMVQGCGAALPELFAHPWHPQGFLWALHSTLGSCSHSVLKDLFVPSLPVWNNILRVCITPFPAPSLQSGPFLSIHFSLWCRLISLLLLPRPFSALLVAEDSSEITFPKQPKFCFQHFSVSLKVVVYFWNFIHISTTSVWITMSFWSILPFQPKGQSLRVVQNLKSLIWIKLCHHTLSHKNNYGEQLLYF